MNSLWTIIVARPPVGPPIPSHQVLLLSVLWVYVCVGVRVCIMWQLHYHLVQPSPYGEPVPPQAAPEAITKAVASLPPEQMFELMRQMKVLWLFY